MDKLEPILKNHFWILLVPLLSMNLWGYFSANGALKEATTKRQGELDSVKSGVPAGETKPNELYTKELKERNTVLTKYVEEELLDLWNRQKVRMVWPDRVAPKIPKVYLSEIKDNQVRYTYQTDYPDVVRKLHESVEPFVADKRGITWTPKVDFPIQLIPQMKIGKLTIESKQMWEAQEDIWVTQFILDAIRQMNKDADSETSAVIRRVMAYRLLGGDGQTSAAGGGADGGSSGGEGDGAAMLAAGYNGGPDGGSSGGGGALGGGGGKISSSVKFDPAEEFGAGGEPAGGGGGAGGYGGSSGGMAQMMMPEEGAADPAAAPTGPLRYVKEDTNAPFVERGFYLSVIINQNKLVDFLVALSNSEWPVRVVRFHFGKNPYAPDPFAAAAAGGGMAGAGGGGAFGSGGAFGGRGGRTAPAMNIPQSYGNEASEGSGFGSFTGAGGGGGGGAIANTGYPPNALQHPDLVQLDLAGVITMYRQPESEKVEPGAPAAEGDAPAADGEAPAEKSAEGDSAAPAAEEMAPAAGETPAEAAPVDPATAPADTTNPAAPPAEPPAAVPAAEGAAEPAPAVPAAGSPPAADSPAPAPDASEAAAPEKP